MFNPPPNFRLGNSRKNLLCLIHSYFLEFVVAKFSFCPTFYLFVLTKSKNLYRLHSVLKHKIYIVFRTNAKACSCKNATSLSLK